MFEAGAQQKLEVHLEEKIDRLNALQDL